MVLGTTSKYVEGFTLFTADDEIMLANLKQAINYSKQNVAISNVPELPATIPQNVLKNSPNQMSSGVPAMPVSQMSSGVPANPASQMSSGVPASPASQMSSGVPAAPASVNNFKNTKTKKEKFTNNRNNKIYDEDDDDDDNDDNEKFINDERDDEEKKDNFKDKGEEEDEEGFQGSQQINLDTTKKLLLSLLITFFGYVILICGHKYHYLDTLMKQLNIKNITKNIQCCAIFFVIVYLCIYMFV